MLALAIGLPGALAASHLTVLSVASLFYREEVGDGSETKKLLILIPAHNEEHVLGRTLETVTQHIRHTDRVLVVADRCTDNTVEVARAHEFDILERPLSAPAGKAASILDGIKHASRSEWDALVVIDADTSVEPGFAEAIEHGLSRGFRAMQPRSEHTEARGILARVSQAAFALQGVSIPRGREQLGFSCRLRGAGMTLARQVALSQDFGTRGASEDLYMTMHLILKGERIAHLDNARLRSLHAPSVSSAAAQRRRWEAGRMAAALEFAFPLFKAGTLTAFEAGIFLVTPPLSVALLSLSVASAMAWVAGWSSLSFGFAIGVILIALDVAIGLSEARSPWRTWIALLVAPLYVVWKLGIQWSALLKLGRSAEPWEPTERG